VKGLYRRARAGEIANFTGVSSSFEPPEQPECRIDTTTTTAAQAADLIIEQIIGIWSPMV
jgi:bifunctional enzyme CysN/CysC